MSTDFGIDIVASATERQCRGFRVGNRSHVDVEILAVAAIFGAARDAEFLPCIDDVIGCQFDAFGAGFATFQFIGCEIFDIVIKPLSGAERQMAWISNSFLLDIKDEDLLARHFDWTHRIAGQVPTFSLDYPRDYGMLAEVRNIVRQHAMKLVA
mgnify:CR=1 FL=1